VEGACNLVTELCLMDQGLQNVSVNGDGFKRSNKVPTDSKPGKDLSCICLVGVAHQIGQSFRLEVKVGGKLQQSRESRWHTAPNASDEHFYQVFMLPEEPQQEMLSLSITVLEEL